MTGSYTNIDGVKPAGPSGSRPTESPAVPYGCHPTCGIQCLENGGCPQLYDPASGQPDNSWRSTRRAS